MDGGVDAHRDLIGILGRDALVHLEQVAVARLDDLDAEALDRVLEIEVDRQAGVADAVAFVGLLLGRPRRDVAGHEVAEARIAALEVVVALGFWNLIRGPACRPSSSAPRRGRRCAATRT